MNATTEFGCDRQGRALRTADIVQATVIAEEIAVMALQLIEVFRSIQSAAPAADHVTRLGDLAVRQLGWLADLATEKLGGNQMHGSAEEWLLPPVYFGRDEVGEATKTGAAST